MSKRKGIVAGLVVALVLALVLVAAACGGSSSGSTSTGSPSATGQAIGLTGTPEANFTQILGHAPTGLAKKIAQRGYIIVSNDPNYPPQSSVDPTTKKLIGFESTPHRHGEDPQSQGKWVHPNWATILRPQPGSSTCRSAR